MNYGHHLFEALLAFTGIVQRDAKIGKQYLRILAGDINTLQFGFSEIGQGIGVIADQGILPPQVVVQQGFFLGGAKMLDQGLDLAVIGEAFLGIERLVTGVGNSLKKMHQAWIVARFAVSDNQLLVIYLCTVYTKLV